MKIAIIAANGRAGKLIMNEALERGLDVTAIVRDKTKIRPFTSPPPHLKSLASTPSPKVTFTLMSWRVSCLS